MSDEARPARKRRLQVHLSTAVVMMFVAGGIIWAIVKQLRKTPELTINQGEDIAKIMDFENWQNFDCLYIRLNSHRIISISRSWPMTDIEQDKANFTISFLSTLEKPLHKTMNANEMKNVCLLFARYFESEGKRETFEKEAIDKLKRLATLTLKKQIHKAESDEIFALPVARIPQYLAMLYMLRLKETLETMGEDTLEINGHDIFK